MTPPNIFYLVASAGFIILIGIIAYTAYQLVKTLKWVRLVVDDVLDTTHDVRIVKNTFKLSILQIASAILGMFFKKGGEKYAK